jgi:hypothetical protein
MQRSAMPNSSGPAFPNAIFKRDSQTQFSSAILKRFSNQTGLSLHKLVDVCAGF